MARTIPPSDQPNMNPSDENTAETTWEVELLHVLVGRKGTHVEAQWAIHPQLKQDLLPKEWQEVTDLMTQATDIVSHRFSEALSNADSMPPGNA
jgi:hypothetical protein